MRRNPLLGRFTSVLICFDSFLFIFLLFHLHRQDRGDRALFVSCIHKRQWSENGNGTIRAGSTQSTSQTSNIIRAQSVWKIENNEVVRYFFRKLKDSQVHILVISWFKCLKRWKAVKIGFYFVWKSLWRIIPFLQNKWSTTPWRSKQITFEWVSPTLSTVVFLRYEKGAFESGYSIYRQGLECYQFRGRHNFWPKIRDVFSFVP